MAGPFTQFGSKNGHLDQLDWDRAIALNFGALHDPIKNLWFLPISPLYVEDPQTGPVEIDKALVVYKRPEPTQIEMKLPEIAIICSDVQPDPARLYSPTVQYRVPCEGATRASVGGMLGWTSYETKDKEQPYELVYTIECWARYRTVAKMLQQMIMAAYPIKGSIKIKDGLGVERTYLATQEGTADLTEVSSMVDRVCGYSVTVRVEAELTLDRVPSCETAFTGGQSTTPPPGTPVDPNLPSGGIYGDGLTTTRVTVMENEKT
jgi:hypothetical protein